MCEAKVHDFWINGCQIKFDQEKQALIYGSFEKLQVTRMELCMRQESKYTSTLQLDGAIDCWQEYETWKC